MAKKMTEGVGKKIVEALKKQSEIEIIPIPETSDTLEISDDTNIFEETNDNLEQDFNTESEDDDVFEKQEQFQTEDSLQQESEYNEYKDLSNIEEPVMQAFNYHQQMQKKASDSFITELDTFEIPSNIAVLKKLISQLPSGVSKHTGAQIIKQTMEALGISMKGVLQEAQQVQEGLNVSAKECMNTIQEYKKQMVMLEKQAQNYHRQYSALNDLISLFVQTGI